MNKGINQKKKIVNFILILLFVLLCYNIKAQDTESFIIDSILVKGENFKAYLYKPKNLTELKPIIVLGGSDGGIRMKDITKDYAKEGFAALNVAYFDYESLPKHLAEIPIEYFEEPIEWLLNQEYVKSSTVAIHGFSRGAELSLLLASEYPEISVVIAMSASNVRWGGWGGWGDDRDESADSKCAWTKSGIPMPYMVTEFDSVEYYKCINNADYFKRYLLDKEAVKKATIPIHKANAAILLISGAKDDVWSSVEMSESIIDLLQKENYPYTYRHMVFENSTHYFDLKKVRIDEKPYWDSIINFINKNIR